MGTGPRLIEKEFTGPRSHKRLRNIVLAVSVPSFETAAISVKVVTNHGLDEFQHVFATINKTISH